MGRLSLDTPMLTVLPMKTTTPSPATLFSSTEEPSPGAQNDSRLSPSLIPRPNMSSSLTPPKGAVWLRECISEIYEPQDPMTPYSDSVRHGSRSQRAIPCSHQAYRHLIPFHSLYSRGRQNHCRHGPTEDMVAGTLTKALPSAKAKHFGTALGLRKV